MQFSILCFSTEAQQHSHTCSDTSFFAEMLRHAEPHVLLLILPESLHYISCSYKMCLIEGNLPLASVFLKSNLTCHTSPCRLDLPGLHQQEPLTPVNSEGTVIHKLLPWRFLTLQALSAIKPRSVRASPALCWTASVCCTVTLLLTAVMMPKYKLICWQEEGTVWEEKGREQCAESKSTGSDTSRK